jgi:hypothetical protein
MNIPKTLYDKTEVIVQNATKNAEDRYNLRYKFYKTYGSPLTAGEEGLGNSELAFIKWEIRRGTLNALDDKNSPGSPWWREVNTHFLYLGTLAQLIYKSKTTYDDIPVPVKFWLEYMHDPNECSWYRAHNSSIISGYIKANAIAFNETVYEQYFMNIVLYRLLYAQSMVEGVSFGILGKLFANPRGGAVKLITDIEAFYPSHYPLSKEDIKYVTHHAHNLSGRLEAIFDAFLILPHLDKLYTEAALWNESPQLRTFVKNNHPIYPIATQHTDAARHFTNFLQAQHIPN